MTSTAKYQMTADNEERTATVEKQENGSYRLTTRQLYEGKWWVTSSLVFETRDEAETQAYEYAGN